MKAIVGRSGGFHRSNRACRQLLYQLAPAYQSLTARELNHEKEHRDKSELTDLGEVQVQEIRRHFAMVSGVRVKHCCSSRGCRKADMNPPPSYSPSGCVSHKERNGTVLSRPWQDFEKEKD